MLALKNISTKKLVIYVSVIILALGGTGFMLYQNQKLTNKNSLVIDNPAQDNEFTADETNAFGDQAVPSKPLADVVETGVGLNQIFEAEKIENNKEIDLTIFSSEKFKTLKANTLIPREDPALGKRDLFQPN